MARATDADVRALMVDMEATVDTDPFIASASAVADEMLDDDELSEILLTQIEIFLACHFAVLAVEKGGMRQESVGGISEAFQTGAGNYTGFNSTRFGQTAVALDTTGVLAAASKGNQGTAEFRVY